jgi:hypothetical protein
MTDMDSLVYEIQTDDFYADTNDDIEARLTRVSIPKINRLLPLASRSGRIRRSCEWTRQLVLRSVSSLD